jgi:predicted acetyltransferase
MSHAIPDDKVLDVRTLLHDANDELSIAVLQLEMMLEAGTVESQSRESLEESLDACRKAADRLKQVWSILGPRPQP